MSFELAMILVFMIIGFIFLTIIIWRFAPKPTKKSKFQSQWKELQKYCAHKETWPAALIKADDLLDMALRRRRFKGANMGERLVAAQKVFTDNDSLWVAHKLSSKLREHPKARLQEKDVKSALVSLRQGLKDLEVL